MLQLEELKECFQIIMGDLLKSVEEFISLWKDKKYKIPQSAEITKELVEEMEKGGKINREKLKENFGKLVEEMQIRVYERYSEYEEQKACMFFSDYFSRYSDRGADGVIKAVASHFRHLDKFYLSVSQSRRTRAGKAFEDILKELFIRMEYPFVEKPVINGRPDFVLPSKEYYKKNAVDCIIFTSKRTLRERWRQIVTEGSRGLGFYLATIDEAISKKALNEMREHRIFVVVPERIKDKFYSDSVNVITFSEFFDEVDHKIKMWRKRNVI